MPPRATRRLAPSLPRATRNSDFYPENMFKDINNSNYWGGIASTMKIILFQAGHFGDSEEYDM